MKHIPLVLGISALFFVASPPVFAATVCAINPVQVSEKSGETDWPNGKAQSFTVLADCTLSAVGVMIDGVGTPFTETLGVWNDNGSNQPNSASIIETGSTLNVPTSLAWATSTFAGIHVLHPATTYWIVLENNSGNTEKMGYNTTFGAGTALRANDSLWPPSPVSDWLTGGMTGKYLNYEVDGSTPPPPPPPSGSAIQGSIVGLPVATSSLAAVAAGAGPLFGATWPVALVAVGLGIAAILVLSLWSAIVGAVKTSRRPRKLYTRHISTHGQESGYSKKGGYQVGGRFRSGRNSSHQV